MPQNWFIFCFLAKTKKKVRKTRSVWISFLALCPVFPFSNLTNISPRIRGHLPHSCQLRKRIFDKKIHSDSARKRLWISFIRPFWKVSHNHNFGSNISGLCVLIWLFPGNSLACLKGPFWGRRYSFISLLQEFIVPSSSCQWRPTSLSNGGPLERIT